MMNAHNPSVNGFSIRNPSFSILLHRLRFSTLLSFAHGIMWGYMRCFAEESQDSGALEICSSKYLPFATASSSHLSPSSLHSKSRCPSKACLGMSQPFTTKPKKWSWEPLLLNSSSRLHKLIWWIVHRLFNVLWPSQLLRRILWKPPTLEYFLSDPATLNITFRTASRSELAAESEQET